MNKKIYRVFLFLYWNTINCQNIDIAAIPASNVDVFETIEMTPYIYDLYILKYSNTDLNDNEAINILLKRYDKNYSTFSSDEFQLKRKINEYRETLKREISSLSKIKYFHKYLEQEFGQYDFEKKAFFTEGFNGCFFKMERNYLYDCFITTDEYNGIYSKAFYGKIPLEMDEAEHFIQKRKINGKHTRKIYSKIYYSLYPLQKDGGIFGNSIQIYGKVEKIDYYSERCNPASKLKAETIYNENIVKESYFETKEKTYNTLSDENGYITFWTATFEEDEQCIPYYFNAQFKIINEGTQKKIKFKFYTNTCINILGGQKIEFKCKNGQNFKAEIKEGLFYNSTDQNIYIHEAVIIVSKDFLDIIKENKLEKIEFQLTNNEYVSRELKQKYNNCERTLTSTGIVCGNCAEEFIKYLNNENLTKDIVEAAVIDRNEHIANTLILDSAAAYYIANEGENANNFYLDLFKSTTHWEGYYTCSQGKSTILNFEIKPVNNRLEGIFSFKDKNVTGKFKMIGIYDINSKKLSFVKKEWIDRPNGYEMIDFEGELLNNKIYKGMIKTIGCNEFYLIQK